MRTEAETITAATAAGEKQIKDEPGRHGSMRLVIVESPFAGDVNRNVTFARDCLADCLARGEAPFASHLLYTQPGVLRDEIPEERARGMVAGFAWGDVAHATVVYTDLGISEGMQKGINRAKNLGRPVEYRTIAGPVDAIAPHVRQSDQHDRNDRK